MGFQPFRSLGLAFRVRHYDKRKPIKEAGFDRVRDLFIQAAQGDVELLLSAVNWGEIVGALLRRAGGLSPSALTNIGSLVANLAALPLTVVAADKNIAEAAAVLKFGPKGFGASCST